MRAARNKISAADLRRLVQRFVRDFGLLEQNQTPCGKPLPVSHAHALMVLLESDPKLSELTQKDLASALGIDKSNIARLCQRMEDAGHIEQRRSPSDGRARFVKLTKQGADVAREVERSSRERFSSLLESMPRAERSNVLHGLTILTEAVSRSRPTSVRRG